MIPVGGERSSFYSTVARDKSNQMFFTLPSMGLDGLRRLRGRASDLQVRKLSSNLKRGLHARRGDGRLWRARYSWRLEPVPGSFVLNRKERSA